MHSTVMNYFNVTLGWVTGEALVLHGLRDADDESVDEATLVQGIPCQSRVPLRYTTRQQGRAYDWNWGLFLLPIIRNAIAPQVLQIAGEDIELVALQAPGVDEEMSIVNILTRRDCVDETRSAEVRRFTEADGQPNRIGQYKWIGGLVVDPARVRGANLLRIAGYEAAMVASQQFVDTAKRANWTGIDFFAPTHESRLKRS